MQVKQGKGAEMKNILLVMAVILGFISSQADVVTFSAVDGYTNGDSVTAGTLAPGGTFTYQKSGSSSAVISNQAIRIDGGSWAAGWVKDATATAYSSISGKWYRSTDIKLSSDTVDGTDDKMSVALVSGAIGDDSFITWADYSLNYVLETTFFEKDNSYGQFILRRLSSDGSVQWYALGTDSWGTSNIKTDFDITHTLNVQYIYDADIGQFTVKIRDITDGLSLVDVSMGEADMATFVGGTNTVRFAAGDMWSNSGQGMVVELDNISDIIPEPATMSLMIVSSLAITGIRYLHRCQ